MNHQIKWILDVDVRKYFDTLKHATLGELLELRVRDGVIRRLIGKWLHAGVLEGGRLSYPEEGTPQGGVITPRTQRITFSLSGQLPIGARVSIGSSPQQPKLENVSNGIMDVSE